MTTKIWEKLSQIWQEIGFLNVEKFRDMETHGWRGRWLLVSAQVLTSGLCDWAPGEALHSAPSAWDSLSLYPPHHSY